MVQDFLPTWYSSLEDWKPFFKGLACLELGKMRNMTHCQDMGIIYRLACTGLAHVVAGTLSVA